MTNRGSFFILPSFNELVICVFPCNTVAVAISEWVILHTQKRSLDANISKIGYFVESEAVSESFSN